MKTLILTTFTLFFTGYLYGQNFSKDYFEHCRIEWKKKLKEDKKKANSVEDSLIYAMTGRHSEKFDVQKAKVKTLNDIIHYQNIMQLKNVNIDTLNYFILIEESELGGDLVMATIKSGIIVLNKTFFSYHYDLVDSNSLILTNNFLEEYDTINKNNPRSILFHLAKNKKEDKISALVVEEMKIINPLKFHPTKQFEVLIYDRYSIEKIRFYYLHELLTELY